MTKKEMKEELARLAELYPDVHTIWVEYQGSGDSFEEFYTIEGQNANGAHVSDIDQDEIDDVLWWAIDQLGADFNNEGSRGDITLHLKTGKITGDNYIYHVSETLDSSLDSEE